MDGMSACKENRPNEDGNAATVDSSRENSDNLDAAEREELSSWVSGLRRRAHECKWCLDTFLLCRILEESMTSIVNILGVSLLSDSQSQALSP